MRERLRETRENDLRKLTQTEGKGKDAHTLTHVPQTQIRNLRIERQKSKRKRPRATKVAKRIVDTRAELIKLTNFFVYYSADDEVVCRPNNDFSIFLSKLYEKVVK